MGQHKPSINLTYDAHAELKPLDMAREIKNKNIRFEKSKALANQGVDSVWVDDANVDAPAQHIVVEDARALGGSSAQSSLVDWAGWLPFAAKHYNISPDVKDYVVIPVPTIITDIPNRNGISFPLKELIQFRPELGMQSYRTWKGKPCLTGDTLISTDKGLIRIDEVRVKGATKVLSRKGWATIEDWWFSGVKSTYTVTTKRGHTIRATADHKVLVLSPDLTYTWKEVSKLNVGDYVVNRLGSCVKKSVLDLRWAVHAAKTSYRPTFTFVSKTGNKFEKPRHQVGTHDKFPTKMTEDLARLLGYIASEGNFTTGSTLSVYNTSKEIVSDYIRCFKSCFGIEPNQTKQATRPIDGYKPNHQWLYKLSTHNTEICAWLAALGVTTSKASEKSVPWVILESSEKFVREFLMAYLEGDGCVSGTGFCIDTTSPRMSQELTLLIESLGYPTKRRIKRASLSGTNLYTLHPVKDASTLLIELGIVRKSRIKKRKDASKYVKLFTKTKHSDKVPYVREYIKHELEAAFTGEYLAACHVDAAVSGPGGAYRVYRSLSGKPKVIKGKLDQSSVYAKETVAYYAKELGRLDKKHSILLKDLLGDFCFVEISSIVKDEGRSKVYDIQTSTHEFVANGLVVHNCFEEHVNTDHTKAKGVILDTHMRKIPGMNVWRLMKLLAFDRTRDPQLCDEILSRKRNSYSMGAYLDGYTCSICHKEFGTCTHTPVGAKKGDVIFVPQGDSIVFLNVVNPEGFETSSVKTPAFIPALNDNVIDMSQLIGEDTDQAQVAQMANADSVWKFKAKR